jgi:amino acid adenylation domain-containing protein
VRDLDKQTKPVEPVGLQLERPATHQSAWSSPEEVDGLHARATQNGGGDARPDAASVQELFEQQVEQTPDAVAVVFAEARLTYRELNSRANQLAHYLQSFGLGPESLVGLCVERSFDMLTGLLAILKSGAAYVPLDPFYPKERLAFMLEDAGARVLLTQERLLGALPERRPKVVCIDRDWSLIEREQTDNLDVTTAPDNLAYVIYTSGSTGKPKGVMISHRGLVNYLTWCTRAYGVSDGDGALVHSSLSFDLTITSLLSPLLCGKCVFLVPEDLGIEQLADALRSRQNYSLAKITPAHLRALSERLSVQEISGHVRALVIGGEALQFEHLSSWREHAPATRLINEYGPTETVVGCCVYEVARDDPKSGPVPIGRATANTDLFVLDDKFNPVAVDATGELYIGGLGVARGYLNRAELTAENFIPNPFSKVGGERLYRTGDLACVRADSNIDFIGRNDSQVKVRGFRVELGEIENALAQDESVDEAVVVAIGDGRREKRLVAYLVAKDGALGIADLRKQLKQNLPEYMIPTQFVILPELPLTPNGKVDRRALPLPDKGNLQLSAEHFDSRDSLELGLREIWEEVLSVRPIGIRDDFFELGGDSILGARVFAQIESNFDRKLPLAILFQSSTIEALAKILRDGALSSAWPSLVPIRPEGSKPPLFCLHACDAHLLMYRPLVRHLDQDQPVYGFRAQGQDGSRAPYTRVEDMATHYVNELREFQPHGPYYLVGDTLGGLLALEMALQLTDQDQEVAFLALFDTRCPLPQSLGRRMLAHLLHFKDLGPKAYLAAAARAVKKRVARKVGAEIPVTVEEKTYVAETAAADDPLVRTQGAIFQATEINYVPPRRRYPGKITYFLARDNEYESSIEDNRRQWRRVASEFEVYVIPGRHETIKEEPYVAELARTFTACLEQAQRRSLNN